MNKSIFRAEIYPIIKGILLTFFIMLSLAAVSAAAAYFAAIPAKYYHSIGAICLVLSLFFGGFAAARTGFDKGWLKGLTVGFFSALIALLFSLETAPSAANIISGSAYFIISGTIGGICGIK